MKERVPRIGELAVGSFDQFDASLRAFRISIGNPTATEDVAAGNSRAECAEQKVGENRFAANIASAMSKVRNAEETGIRPQVEIPMFKLAG
jgi:hypothetical protein